jgi:broad specificity phosphatase PhoE
VKFVLILPGEIDGSALSETGRSQASAVAAELGNAVNHAGVLSSPAAYARETAQIIAEALGVSAPEDRGELGSLDDNHHESAMETAWAIIERAKTELEPDATLVLVTHEINVRLFICRALGIPLAEMHRFALDPGSMSTIEWRTQPRERLLIASLNEVCHLEALA